MVDDADVGVEGGAGSQLDQVATLLGIDQQDPLSWFEDAPVLAALRGRFLRGTVLQGP
jgi:hypothetical protein